MMVLAYIAGFLYFVFGLVTFATCRDALKLPVWRSCLCGALWPILWCTRV